MPCSNRMHLFLIASSSDSRLTFLVAMLPLGHDTGRLTGRADVGRVSDWHKAATTNEGPAATESAAAAPAPCASGDPGVVLTVDLKEYFVAHGFSTQVMAASFRNADQVAALAACDHLTIGERGRRGFAAARSI